MRSLTKRIRIFAPGMFHSISSVQHGLDIVSVSRHACPIKMNIWQASSRHIWIFDSAMKEKIASSISVIDKSNRENCHKVLPWKPSLHIGFSIDEPRCSSCRPAIWTCQCEQKSQFYDQIGFRENNGAISSVFYFKVYDHMIVHCGNGIIYDRVSVWGGWPHLGRCCKGCRLQVQNLTIMCFSTRMCQIF